MSLEVSEKFRCCLRKFKHESSACVALTASMLEEAKHLGEPATTEGIDELCQFTPRKNEVGLLLASQSGSQEHSMLAKTTWDQLSTIQQLLGKNHSYDFPCLLALPILWGNREFLNWIKEETYPQESIG